MSTDRTAAGSRLAHSLETHDRTGSVVIGIPRGGAVVGAKVALELGLAYECVPVCRVAVPCFPSLTLGAIDPDGTAVFDPHTQITRHELSESYGEFAEHLKNESARCRGDRVPVDITGRDLIVVDDATGSQLVAQAAAEYLRRHGAGRLVFATPVVAEDVLPELRELYDEVVADKVVRSSSVPGYYSTNDVSDEELHSCMARAWDASPKVDRTASPTQV